MKKFLTLIITFIIICVSSLGALSLVGCGRDLDPDSGNVPVTTPDGDESSGDNDGTGSGDGSSDGSSSSGPSAGNNQQQTDIHMSPSTIWTCSCGYGNLVNKSHCGRCGLPKPTN